MILDVRCPEEYMVQHIPGAINIPLVDLMKRSADLDQQAIIITTCGKGGGRSEQGAELLRKLGFLDAHYLCGGNLGWLLQELLKCFPCKTRRF